jgi:uncharacterized protein (DUF2267 family)
MGEKGDVTQTRKEFLEAIIKIANVKDFKQADDAGQAVISLTKQSLTKNPLKRLRER